MLSFQHARSGTLKQCLNAEQFVFCIVPILQRFKVKEVHRHTHTPPDRSISFLPTRVTHST